MATAPCSPLILTPRFRLKCVCRLCGGPLERAGPEGTYLVCHRCKKGAQIGSSREKLLIDGPGPIKLRELRRG